MGTISPPAGKRIVRRDALASCPFSAAIECAESYLQEAAERGRIDELLVDTRLSVLVVEDYTDPVRRHDALEFGWRPASALFPRGQALLTVRPHAPQGTQLQFSISYRPPLRTIGRIFDACIGRYIAWITTGLLVNRLRTEIERRARTEGS